MFTSNNLSIIDETGRSDVMASAVAATNKWLLTKRSQCGTERLWDNKLRRERRVRDFCRSLHRTRHRVWDVKTTRAPLLHCKVGVPFKSDKRKEAQDTRRRTVSELRRVQQASSVFSAFIWRMDVECRMHDMYDSRAGCGINGSSFQSRQTACGRAMAEHAVLCTVLYFTAVVCYTKKVKFTG